MSRNNDDALFPDDVGEENVVQLERVDKILISPLAYRKKFATGKRRSTSTLRGYFERT